MAELKGKQELFCREYIIDLNATAAAKRAGYSEKTAYFIGHENLKKPKVAERIRELQQDRLEQVELTAEWVLERLKLESKREGKGSSHSARVRALELLGRHTGLLKDGSDINVSLAPVQIIEQVVTRETLKTLEQPNGHSSVLPGPERFPPQ